VPWSKWLKSQEEEVADDVLVIMMELIQASHHMADPELLLGILQQGDEGALAAIGQLTAGDAHVQSLLPQHTVPASAHTTQASGRETNLDCRVLVVVHHAVVIISFPCTRFLLSTCARRVRGIFRIPRASALWEFPTCAGGIKPAVEAPHPGRRRRPWWSWWSTWCCWWWSSPWW